MNNSGFESVIGLEIHVQLKTKTKIFCTDATNFDAGDNENTSPVSLGMPGTLPVLNKTAIDMAIKTGLALNCKIREKSVFSRKNYFYPDLSKGYQISQYDEPLCEDGYVEIKTEDGLRKINIVRAHVEEDAGKSTHSGDYTLINYNRAGIPLLEIVSAPEIKSAKEASEYAKTIRQIVRYLDVCDGNLEEGSLRCDCNVSVRKVGETKLGTKVEIKNLNSFRFIEKAIDFEIDRQIDQIERGQKIIQETRLYDPDKNKTFSMRTKEDAQDYRYFPDPDLLPIFISKESLTAIKKDLPELPFDRAIRFTKQYGLPEYDAEVLTAEKQLADYFERVGNICKNFKSASNWIMVELIRELNNSNTEIKNCPIKEDDLALLIEMIDQNKISGKIAKSVFLEMWSTKKSPEAIVAEKGLQQISNESEIEKIVEEILNNNQAQVLEYKSGKTKVIGFFVGNIMRATKGQANPDVVNKILLEKLKG